MAFLVPENLKSRREVPEPVRRCASALQIGLDETATVWYEPPYDPDGSKPHLVVLMPDRGIVVLEVLQAHAARVLGVFERAIRIARDGVEVALDNPLERAERFARVLAQRVRGEPRLAGVEVAIASGAVFPALSEAEAADLGLADLVDPSRCLFSEQLDAAIRGSGEAGLLRQFAHMLGSRAAPPLPPEAEPILRGVIQPEALVASIASGAAPAAAPRQFTLFRVADAEGECVAVMDRKQEAIAKALGGGHRVIRGVAGSGKTLILVYRARLLARANPTRHYLVTCYTRTLAGELRQLLAASRNVEVENLDRIMASTIHDAGLTHPGYGDDPGGEQVAAVALRALTMGYGPRYAGVLLDEAQDFATGALRFTVGLLEPGEGELVVVADAAQNIFRRKFSWRQAGIQAQGRTRILRANYRNTREILEFACRFLAASKQLTFAEAPDEEDENALIPPETALRAGPKPEVFVAGGVLAEANWAAQKAVQWVAEAGARPKSVAILYAAGQGADGTDRAGALLELLRTAGVDVFWLTDPRDRAARDQLSEVRAPVVVSSIHSAKGLEFPGVILCGIWRDEEDDESNRRLAYVGMTRASERLAVVVSGSGELAADLCRAQQDQTD